MSKNKEKRWELLGGVEKGMEDLLNEYDLVENIVEIQEIKVLIESLKHMKTLREKITKQEEELKLRLLISSRERNIYLEKLRKIEEYGENKNWKDDDNVYLNKISEILYNDAVTVNQEDKNKLNNNTNIVNDNKNKDNELENKNSVINT